MRHPTPLTSAPASSPYEAMAASQQAHIDDLVQKNRASEVLIKRLQQDLEREKERSLDVAAKLKAAASEERREWKDGCDSLLAAHRIVHLRTRVELERERSAILKERDGIRKERLAVLQRDYRLTLFQARESQLERDVAELEAELEAEFGVLRRN